MAEALAGPEGARRRRAVPEAVRKQVQGCSEEKRRKGPRLPAPARSPGRVQRAPKCRGARAGDIEGLPSGHTHPEPRRLTERGQRASSSPSVTWSAEHRPNGFCVASLLPAPLYLPRGWPSTILDPLCLRSPLAQSPLSPPPSFLSEADHIIS